MKLNVFVLHAKFLVDRTRTIDELQKQLGKYSFKNCKMGDFKIISEHDPSDLTPEFLQKHVNYSPFPTEDEKLKFYNGALRMLHINNISNAMKHYEALKCISEKGESINLVLEDDVLFEPGFCAILDETIGKLADKQLVFIGLPNNEEMKDKTIKFKDTKEMFKVLPYNDSYFVTPSTAKMLIEKFFPIKFLTNIQLTYLCDITDVKIFQTVPNVFIDGTKYGMYLSSLMANNELAFNKDYMMVKSVLNKVDAKQDLIEDEKKMLDQLFEKSDIREHPDFLLLKTKYLRYVKKNIKGAYDLYKKLFDVYKKNNCIVNNECMLLREYISVHAEMQDDI